MASRSGIEQRRHVRRALYLDARLAWRGRGGIACRVRDFCRGGMFLSWPDEGGVELPLQAGDSVEVEVSVPGGGTLQLGATVARVLEAGIGCAFPDAVDLEALASLDKLAQAAPRPAGAGGLANAAELRARVADISLRHFSAIVDRFLKRADEGLFLQARDASNDVEQRGYFDSMNMLKKRAAELGDGMRTTMRTYLDNLGGEVDMVEHSEGGGLSLLEKDEFEELLIIGNIVSKSEPRYKEQLWRLESRLAKLTDAGLDRSNNPVAPGSVCRIIADAIHPLELPIGHVRLLYDIVDELTMPALGAWYAELESCLDEAGVEAAAAAPVKPPPVSRPRRPEASLRPIDEKVEEQASPDPGATAAPAPETQAPGSGSGAADAAPVSPPAGTPAMGASAGTQLPAAGPSMSPAPGPARAGQGPAVNADPGATGGPVAAGPLPASGQYQAARTLLDLQRALGETLTGLPVAPVNAAGQAAGPLFSNTDLVSAIQSLEAEDAGPWGGETESTSFEQRLRTVLHSRDGEARVAPRQADALALASGVTDAIRGDELVPAAIRPMMQRLRGMLHKLAVLDQGFLEDPAHPGRRIVNRLAELDLEATGSEEDGPLRERLEALIEELRNFDGDPALLERVLQELDDLTEERSRQFRERVRALVQDCEKKDKADRALRGGKGHEAGDKQVSPEWKVWLDRARGLSIGDPVQLRRANQQALRVVLAWVGENHGQFVFVNARGERVAGMTLQELGMQLRRGTVRILARSELPVMDRAIFSTLYRIHDKVGRKALHDPVTGLVNRKKFVRELQRSVVAAGGDQATDALVLIRLEGVRELIAAGGDPVRDALVRKVAGLVSQSMEGEDFLLGRADDMDFALLARGLSAALAEERAGQLLTLVRKVKVRFREQAYPLAASLGVLALAGDIDGAEQAMARVEQAVLEAQSAGGDRVQLAGEVAAAAAVPAYDWESWLRAALDDNRLDLGCQRVIAVTADSDKPAFTEVGPVATVDDRLNLLPEDFGTAHDMAESMCALDRLVIARALQWLARYPRPAGALGGLAVNLSRHSLADAGLMDYILGQLTETMVPPGRVCFEIAEAAAVANLDAVERLVRTLREFGCRFVLDRFGGADTSQGYLNRLPVDFIKIDPVFVADLAAGGPDFALVKSIHEIARLTGKQTIAAGVDSADARDRLADIGVSWMQGRLAGGVSALESLVHD